VVVPAEGEKRWRGFIEGAAVDRFKRGFPGCALAAHGPLPQY
jgi:hypothetical protein